MDFKHKNYARITSYGDLLIPTNMLEKLVENAFIVRTSYTDGEDIISEITTVDKVALHDASELKAAAVQIALQGEDK
jgi:hypothetical protein